MDLAQRALQTNGKLFFKFQFQIIGQNRKIFKPREYWLKCNKLCKLMESFFQISESIFEFVTIFFK